jgi:hypothetical protein
MIQAKPAAARIRRRTLRIADPLSMGAARP